MMLALHRMIRSAPAWSILLLMGVLAAGVNLALIALYPPAPRIHDEFSYLLAADTFACGRVTNPTHPHWPHFETMHVIQQPSYASKYPPAQGLLLAAARLITGSEIVGVCVSTGLAAAACVWMLLVWFPKRWAALGGLLVALHPGIQLQWGLSYWGGALAMIAGALVVGGAARLAQQRGPLLAPATLFATGAILLAITRPFEGFVLTLTASIVVGVAWVQRRSVPWRQLGLQAALPICLLGAAGVSGLLAYNAAVTGHPLRMPYQVHEAEYGATPLFLWQTADKDKTYRSDALRRYHLAASMWWFDQQQTLDGLVKFKSWLMRSSLEFFLPAPVALTLLAVGWTRRRELWPWIAAGLATWAAACLTVWMFPHYLAPIAPLMILLVVAGLRSFRTLESRLAPGRRWITPALVGLQMLVFATAAYDKVTEPKTNWSHSRPLFVQGLEKTPGDDLVFVRYSPDHNVHDEWVYNRADIDAASIVWARELSPAEDAALIDYFQDRKVWVLHADESPLRLMPYELAQPLAHGS